MSGTRRRRRGHRHARPGPLDVLRACESSPAANYRTRARRTLTLGVEFDIYWLSPAEMERLVVEAGFQVAFRGGRPAEPDELQPQGYLIGQRW